MIITLWLCCVSIGACVGDVSGFWEMGWIVMEGLGLDVNRWTDGWVEGCCWMGEGMDGWRQGGGEGWMGGGKEGRREVGGGGGLGGGEGWGGGGREVGGGGWGGGGVEGGMGGGMGGEAWMGEGMVGWV